MKIKSFIVISILSLMVITLAGCGGSGGTKPSPEPGPETTSVTLDCHKAGLILGVCPSLTLTAVTDPAGAEVTWTSGDESVATVSAEGVVTAVGEGTCSIKAASGKASDKCRVTVTGPETAIAIFSGTKVFDYTDKTVEVTAKAELDEAEYILLDEVTEAKAKTDDDSEPYFVQNVDTGAICFADVVKEDGSARIVSVGPALAPEMFDGNVKNCPIAVWGADSYTAQMTGADKVVLDDTAYPVLSVVYNWDIEGKIYPEEMKWIPAFAWYAGNEEVTLVSVK
ncbi:MAG: Ig-like domain-containing protein [Abditibacteriota bacterium]|nr:Ig-like domain-containing protein [Abditibacteriota bacterium]